MVIGKYLYLMELNIENKAIKYKVHSNMINISVINYTSNHNIHYEVIP